MHSLGSWLIGGGRQCGFLAAMWLAVPPLWLRFASADVSWIIWIEVIITKIRSGTGRQAGNRQAGKAKKPRNWYGLKGTRTLPTG